MVQWPWLGVRGAAGIGPVLHSGRAPHPVSPRLTALRRPAEQGLGHRRPPLMDTIPACRLSAACPARLLFSLDLWGHRRGKLLGFSHRRSWNQPQCE